MIVFTLKNNAKKSKIFFRRGHSPFADPTLSENGTPLADLTGHSILLNSSPQNLIIDHNFGKCRSIIFFNVRPPRKLSTYILQDLPSCNYVCF